ncbi:CASP-like protein 1B1 [Mercurialis annua]|uniref:CASP-like protein 1B1 n=1 Tax=Mercurialis annua TaxID=3986 RepID=UPI00215E5D4B|nr:CASP-like protein 1B1 [Mercurialis annua]
MALENGEKLDQAADSSSAAALKPKNYTSWVVLLLRVIAFSGTTAATVAMATNKQTKSFTVATIGTTPIQASLTAKFQHTPAFVFFVIANGMASVHNLVMMALQIFAHKFDYKRLHHVTIAILDMLTVGLISGGVNAAVFMAELGKNGNSHAKWNQICDKFERYCSQGGAAIIASFIGLLFMLIITIISILKLLPPKSNAT